MGNPQHPENSPAGRSRKTLESRDEVRPGKNMDSDLDPEEGLERGFDETVDAFLEHDRGEH